MRRLSKLHLLFSNLFQDAIRSAPITLLDVGARGELDPPWSLLSSDSIKLIGFEPDGPECLRLASQSPKHWKYIPSLVGSREESRDFYLARVPTCSSFFPPNTELLEPFNERHVSCRDTMKTLSFKTLTLDKALSENESRSDFIKIDNQGAEYEILLGAAKTLEKDCLAVLVETWTSEVHKGQHLTGSVLELMNQYGFELFDTNIAAAWDRKTKAKYGLFGKSQVIGLDLLFIKKAKTFLNDTPAALRTLKLAAISEVFGFPDYAIEVIEASLPQLDTSEVRLLSGAKRLIIEHSVRRKSIIRRLGRLAGRRVGIRIDDFPALHY